MNIKDFSSNPQKIYLTISIIGLFLCSFAQFITSSVWIVRTSPYFSQFDDLEDIACKAYHHFGFSMFFSLFNCIFIIVIALLLIFCKSMASKPMFSKSAGILFLFVVELMITAAIITFGFMSFLISIKKGGNCYDYLKGSLDEMDAKFGGDEKYEKWKDKFMHNIFDKNGNLTSYLCEEIGVPILIFTLIQPFFIGLLMTSIYFAWKNHDPKNDVAEQNQTVQQPLIQQNDVTPQVGQFIHVQEYRAVVMTAN